MLLIDTEKKTLIQDVELKTKIAKSRPYGEWLKQQVKATSGFISSLNKHFDEENDEKSE